MYTYLQTHQAVYIKYVQLSLCQSYLEKMVKEKLTDIGLQMEESVASLRVGVGG